MQISFVMLLFSNQVSGRGQTASGGGRPLPPPWKKASLMDKNHEVEYGLNAALVLTVF